MQGYTFPAEWSCQEYIYLSWPMNPHTWMDCFPQMEAAYASFAAAITHYELLRILVKSSENERIIRLLTEHDAVLEHVEFFNIATNDAWCRDHGPTFLKHRENGSLALVDFSYNAWGGKFPPWDLDNAVPEQIAHALQCPRFVTDLVCEGGALESNGNGTLLTTRSVVLNSNRNPGISEPEAERILCDMLGMDHVIWLDSGLPGDDTDGHIDTLTRFFRDDAVLTVLGEKTHPGYDAMKRNYETLKQARTAAGKKLEIVPLPVPDPICPEDWREEILPATYANYLVINNAVLLPTYRQDASAEKAISILEQAFPGRDIIPIDCYDIILEGGALHCLSQQQPR